ncbi:hypothetical protein A7K94_0221625, partial [Modestobacter sp. VKM Ac-2676]
MPIAGVTSPCAQRSSVAGRCSRGEQVAQPQPGAEEVRVEGPGPPAVDGAQRAAGDVVADPGQVHLLRREGAEARHRLVQRGVHLVRTAPLAQPGLVRGCVVERGS